MVKHMNKVFFTLVLLFVTFTAIAEEDNPRLKDAESIYRSFEIDVIGARGAVQVSQAADMAQMKYSRMIIAQNEEIISLLRQLAARNKQGTTERPARK